MALSDARDALNATTPPRPAKAEPGPRWAVGEVAAAVMGPLGDQVDVRVCDHPAIEGATVLVTVWDDGAEVAAVALLGIGDLVALVARRELLGELAADALAELGRQVEAAAAARRHPAAGGWAADPGDRIGGQG